MTERTLKRWHEFGFGIAIWPMPVDWGFSFYFFGFGDCVSDDSVGCCVGPLNLWLDWHWMGKAINSRNKRYFSLR